MPIQILSGYNYLVRFGIKLNSPMAYTSLIERGYPTSPQGFTKAPLKQPQTLVNGLGTGDPLAAQVAVASQYSTLMRWMN